MSLLERLDELEALRAKATAGEWKHVSYCGFDIIGAGDRPRKPANRICQLIDEGQNESRRGCMTNHRTVKLAHSLANLPTQYLVATIYTEEEACDPSNYRRKEA